MINIKVGIEIECIYNHRLVDIDIGGYHNGEEIEDIPNWIAERDSSVHRTVTDNFRGSPVEIISKVINNKQDFFREIDEFINYFSAEREIELKKILCFNKTCGAHIHISVPYKKQIFMKKTSNLCLIRTRQKFFKEIKKSNLSRNAKKLILKNYFRSFSKDKLPKDRNSIGDMYDRNREFNFYSEIQGKGIEWRSLSMQGITKWSEFREFWEIVYDCAEYLVKISRKWKEPTKSIRINLNNKKYKDFDKTKKTETIVVDDERCERYAPWDRVTFDEIQEVAVSEPVDIDFLSVQSPRRIRTIQ